MSLRNAINKLKALQRFDIAKETADILSQNRNVLIELLQIQLSYGKDGKDKNVTIFGKPYYSAATIAYKKQEGSGLGAVTDVITNYMSGSFYNSIQVRVSGLTFSFRSSVPYFDEIVRRSGPAVMTLGTEATEYFKKFILKPELERRFKQQFK